MGMQRMGVATVERKVGGRRGGEKGGREARRSAVASMRDFFNKLW